MREAVRIQMRGLVLNKKGTYNRCKLTRLVVDSEWEEQVWKESWVPREEPAKEDQEWSEWEGEECLADIPKPKRPRDEQIQAKRPKLDPGVAWGEGTQPEVAERSTFLHSQEGIKPAKNQSKMTVYSGLAWMCREILKEVANSAVAVGEQMAGVADWEEWEVEPTMGTARRTEREESYLWAMLRVLDRESAGEERRSKARKKKVVEKARKKMGVGRDQPSILDKLKIKPERSAKPKVAKTTVQAMPSSARGAKETCQEEENEQKKPALEPHSVCSDRSGWKSSQAVTASRVAGVVPSLNKAEMGVNTQTGSVRVAASQSNIVASHDSRGEGVNTHTASMRNIVASPSSEVHQKCVQTSSSSPLLTSPDEGEGGVIAHTASMRNIVLDPCDDEVSGCVQAGPELCVQTSQTSCVQYEPSVQPTNNDEYELSSQKYVNTDEELRTHAMCVQPSECVQCTVKIHTECVQQSECVQITNTAESGNAISSNNTERPAFQVAGRRVKAIFDLSKIEGGRFSLKSTLKRGGTEGASKNNICDEDDRSIGLSQIKTKTFPSSNGQLDNCEGGGENSTFNNIKIDIIRTPKRKKASAVSKLVCRFSGANSKLPGVDDSESPAKRRRLWGQGGQGH